MLNDNVTAAFWAELEKIAASIADPVLRAIAKKRVPLKGTARTGKGKEILKALKARASAPKGSKSLTRRVESESPEATFGRMEQMWTGVDPRTGQEISGPAFLQAYGRSAPEQYQSFRAAQQATPAWQARFQDAPTMAMPQQAAAQQRLQAAQAAPRVAPPRTATPTPPAFGAAGVQPVGSGIMGSIRQRLFGTGNMPGVVKTSSVLTEMELEAMRRELTLILAA